MLGTNTSEQAQITSIEKDGFWLLTDDKEYFVPFEQYPDFRDATIHQIYNFQQTFDQFHWPDLDSDIELDALEHPEYFPLKFRR